MDAHSQPMLHSWQAELHPAGCTQAWHSWTASPDLPTATRTAVSGGSCSVQVVTQHPHLSLKAHKHVPKWTASKGSLVQGSSSGHVKRVLRHAGLVFAPGAQVLPPPAPCHTWQPLMRHSASTSPVRALNARLCAGQCQAHRAQVTGPVHWVQTLHGGSCSVTAGSHAMCLSCEVITNGTALSCRCN